MLKINTTLTTLALVINLTCIALTTHCQSTITYCGSNTNESSDYAEFWAGLQSNGVITENFTPEEGVPACANAFCQYNYQQEGYPLYPTSISFDSGSSNFQLMYKGPTLTWTNNNYPNNTYSPGNYYFAWSAWNSYLSSISCDDAVAKASAASDIKKSTENNKIPKPKPRIPKQKNK
jgi:hypothetical protein